MQITTSRFGQIEIIPEEVVEFPEGLLGFDGYHRFVILNTQEGSPFRWLQSVDDGNLAFIIIEPLNFMFSYELEISDEDISFLAIERPEEVVLYAIVTIPENAQDMTANLQGPIVVNARNRKARQVISNNSHHSLKARIMDEMAKRELEMKKVAKSLDPNKKGDKE